MHYIPTFSSTMKPKRIEILILINLGHFKLWCMFSSCMPGFDRIMCVYDWVSTLLTFNNLKMSQRIIFRSFSWPYVRIVKILTNAWNGSTTLTPDDNYPRRQSPHDDKYPAHNSHICLVLNWLKIFRRNSRGWV